MSARKAHIHLYKAGTMTGAIQCIVNCSSANTAARLTTTYLKRSTLFQKLIHIAGLELIDGKPGCSRKQARKS